LTIHDYFYSLPYRFRPEKAQGFSGIFHFILSGNQPAQFTVQINHSECTVSDGLHHTPDCVIETSSQLHIDIETEKANPQWAYMTGKIKVSNIAAMMQYLKLFKRFKPDYLQQQTPANTPKSPQKETTPTRKPQTGPLKGVRILDLSRLLPAPLATMLLADWGAEVIKIEDPHNPDDTRNYPPFIGNQSAYYLAVNRSKRSLQLNLRSPEGKAIFYNLLRTADIVVESFRPGVLQKLGLHYNEAKNINPRIIYVSVTGYGQTGDFATKAGHDINYLAQSGILGLNGISEDAISIPGAQIADVAGGSYLTAIACLLALQNRTLTNTGDHIDVSITDACLPLLSIPFATFFAEGKVPKPGNQLLSGVLPNYNVYQCADGKWLALGALEPKFWAGFCQMINRPHWVNAIIPHSEEAEMVKLELKKLFLTKSSQEWLTDAAHYDICLTAALSLQEAANHPLFEQRQMFTQFTHPAYGAFTAINQPLQFTQTNLPKGWAPPIKGEDTDAILQESGYTNATIQELKNKGIIS